MGFLPVPAVIAQIVSQHSAKARWAVEAVVNSQDHWFTALAAVPSVGGPNGRLVMTEMFGRAASQPPLMGCLPVGHATLSAVPDDVGPVTLFQIHEVTVKSGLHCHCVPFHLKT